MSLLEEIVGNEYFRFIIALIITLIIVALSNIILRIIVKKNCW